MSDLGLRQLPPEVEALVKQLAEAQPSQESARLLANTLNRTVAVLYKLARDQAAAKKGQPDWATWAKLANASRNAVLAASMCREIANQMAAAVRAERGATDEETNQ